MGPFSINDKERRERFKALMARREKRNPSLKGVTKRPSIRNWNYLINDTTKHDLLKSIFPFKSK